MRTNSMRASLRSANGSASTLRRLAWPVAKLALTIAIFGVILRNLDLGKVVARAAAIGPEAFVTATIIVFLQIPLTGFRWREILSALRTVDDPLPSVSVMQTITFAAQIVG